MTGLGFVLVLAAAVCHAVWNFQIKKMNGGPALIWLFSLVAIILYLPLAAVMLIETTPDLWGIAGILILGSAFLHLGYFLLLQQGYRQGDLSQVYPTARATGPLLSIAFAVLFLGENPSVEVLCGGLIIIVGVLGLTHRGRSATGPMAPSLLFGVGAGALIGCYTVWDAYAVATVVISPVLLDYTSSLLRVLVLAPVAHRRWTQVRYHWQHHRGAVVIVAVFSPLAYILVLIALTFTPVSYVAPLREVSVLISVLLGVYLLKEGDLRRRFGWAVIILIGMTVLGLG